MSDSVGRRVVLGVGVVLLVGAAACNQSRNAGGTSGVEPSASASALVKPEVSSTASGQGHEGAHPPPTASATPPPVPKRTDTIPTNAGDLGVTPIYHASILFEYGGKAIYVDPWSKGSFEGLPKADYIFVTDIHPDHLDPAAIEKIKKDSTVLVGPPAVNEKTKMNVVLKNGESHAFDHFKVDGLPMYNLTRGPEPGKLYHDKGRGDGYVFTFGNERVYVSGDTECTPEMRALKNVDVAFVCMNLPYTMPPSEAAACVKAFHPKVVFPYHYRESNVNEFVEAVGPTSDVRVRQWY